MLVIGGPGVGSVDSVLVDSVVDWSVVVGGDVVSSVVAAVVECSVVVGGSVVDGSIVVGGAVVDGSVVVGGGVVDGSIVVGGSDVAVVDSGLDTSDVLGHQVVVGSAGVDECGYRVVVAVVHAVEGAGVVVSGGGLKVISQVFSVRVTKFHYALQN